jgi:hypothetical protein
MLKATRSLVPEKNIACSRYHPFPFIRLHDLLRKITDIDYRDTDIYFRKGEAVLGRRAVGFLYIIDPW